MKSENNKRKKMLKMLKKENKKFIRLVKSFFRMEDIYLNSKNNGKERIK